MYVYLLDVARWSVWRRGRLGWRVAAFGFDEKEDEHAYDEEEEEKEDLAFCGTFLVVCCLCFWGKEVVSFVSG